MKQSAEYLFDQFQKTNSIADFNKLHSICASELHRHVTKITDGDSHLAQDITQDTFIELYRKSKTLAINSSIVGWLKRASRYRAYRYFRSNSARRDREEHATEMGNVYRADKAAHRVQIEALRSAYDGLPQKDQKLYRMRFITGLPLKTIGRELSISASAVDKRLSRLRNKIRKLVVETSDLRLARPKSRNSPRRAKQQCFD